MRRRLMAERQRPINGMTTIASREIASADKWRPPESFNDLANSLSCSGSLKTGALGQALGQVAGYSPMSLARVGSMASAQMA